MARHDRSQDDRNRDEDWTGPSSFGSRGGYGRGLDAEDRSVRRERDFGDSAGYGSGGSARDWHDVMGDDRRRYDDPNSFFRSSGQAGSEPVNHRGRGPKGYTRSDERIREEVADRLTDDPHVDASEIEVVVERGEVTLSGTVSTRFEKRHAEDVAEAVSGVTHLQNNLRIQSPGMSTGESGPTGAVADSMGFGTVRTGMASAGRPPRRR